MLISETFIPLTKEGQQEEGCKLVATVSLTRATKNGKGVDAEPLHYSMD